MNENKDITNAELEKQIFEMRKDNEEFIKKSTKDLKLIKGIAIFFLILTILSIIASIVWGLIVLVQLNSFKSNIESVGNSLYSNQSYSDEEYVYKRSVRWGDSKETVIDTEINNPSKNEADSLLFSDMSLHSKDCDITYQFIDNKLSDVTFSFKIFDFSTDVFYPKDTDYYLSTYDYIKDMVSIELGEAVIEKENEQDDTLINQYLCSWEKENIHAYLYFYCAAVDGTPLSYSCFLKIKNEDYSGLI